MTHSAELVLLAVARLLQSSLYHATPHSQLQVCCSAHSILVVQVSQLYWVTPVMHKGHSCTCAGRLLIPDTAQWSSRPRGQRAGPVHAAIRVWCHRLPVATVICEWSPAVTESGICRMSYTGTAWNAWLCDTLCQLQLQTYT